jgi:hypothetical protein
LPAAGAACGAAIAGRGANAFAMPASKVTSKTVDVLTGDMVLDSGNGSGCLQKLLRFDRDPNAARNPCRHGDRPSWRVLSSCG